MVITVEPNMLYVQIHSLLFNSYRLVSVGLSSVLDLNATQMHGYYMFLKTKEDFTQRSKKEYFTETISESTVFWW